MWFEDVVVDPSGDALVVDVSVACEFLDSFPFFGLLLGVFDTAEFVVELHGLFHV